MIRLELFGKGLSDFSGDRRCSQFLTCCLGLESAGKKPSKSTCNHILGTAEGSACVAGSLMLGQRLRNAVTAVIQRIANVQQNEQRNESVETRAGPARTSP